jgi:dihydroorotase
MQFDLLIRGGEVVDPASGYSGVLDVALQGGTIAAVDREIPAESAALVVDAAGRVVTPGLVDLHTHVYRGVTYWGVDADALAASSGVTTWIDAGSAGALTLPGFREFIVEPATVRIRPFLNVSSVGLVAENHELANLAHVDVDLCRRLVELNRDLVVGVKVRMGTPTVGAHGVEPLRRALRVADECALPLMVHIASAPPGIDKVLGLMRPGDVLTHCFTGQSMKIVDVDGRLLEAARRAWDAGVIMDVGHGAGSFSFATSEALLASGRRPDVISTDAHQLSVRGPMIDLPTCMSKFLALGMSLPEVVRAATSRPAEVLGLEAGTLRPGAPADVTVLTRGHGRFTFSDVEGDVREGRELLRCEQTIVAGQPLERRPAPPPAPWVVSDEPGPAEIRAR